VNIFNRQSRTADKGCSSSLGLDEGVTTPHRTKQLVTKCDAGPRNWAENGWDNILITEREGKRPFGRPKRRWEDNTRTDLRDMV
jgi:hypothetical protein